jgi:hypothetical protein
VPEVVYEVVLEVMKVSEVVSWEVRAMTERMHAPGLLAMPKLCMPPMPPMPPKLPIECAGNVAGATSIATTTAHPSVILRSMTILPVVTPAP